MSTLSWQRAAAIGLTTLAVGMPVSMVAMRALPSRISTLLAWPAYIWMGTMMLLLVLLGSSELVRLAVRIGTSAVDQPLSPQRRVVLSRLIAACVGGLAFGLTYEICTALEVREYL